jgi:ABC-type uncharacterized transport system auxiliary subunit
MKRLVVSALLCFAMGCGGPKTLSEQIILYFDPASPAAMPKPSEKELPFKVQIKELALSHLYDNANVVIRNTDWSVQFSKHGVWAVRPNTSASDLLESVLRNNLRCRALKDRFPDSSPDYVISGSLDAVEDDMRGTVRTARLLLTLSIVRFADTKTLFEKTYRQSGPVSDTGSVELARALSDCLKTVCGQFTTDAIGVFNRELEAADAQSNGKN